MMFIYLLQQLAQAPITNPVLNTSVQNLTGNQFFARLLPSLITLGFVVGSIVFVFMLIIGGIQWITAGGDKAALESARSKIMNALIGILILFSLYAIVNVVQRFFGINILRLNIEALRIS